MTIAALAPVAPSPMLDRDGLPAARTWSLSTETVHLNHGSFGAVPDAASQAQSDLVFRMNSIPGDWFATLPARVGDARRRIAAYIGSDAESTALVPNASAGITVVLNALPLTRGAEILVTDHTYGAVLMAAERAARRVGGRVVVVEVPLSASADDVVAAIVDGAGDRTELAIIDQITSATARLFPVGAISRALRVRGIPTLVDGAHAPGMLADPIDGIDADYWVGNLHKWACTPRGTAALVAGPQATADLHPLIDSWGSLEPYPVRFDTQGTIDVTSYLAAPVALSEIDARFGWTPARRYMTDLADYAAATVADALDAESDEPSLIDVGMPAPAMRLLRLPAGLARTPEQAHELRDRIAAEHGFQTAITSWRGVGYLRLSAHVYNLSAEYDAFAASVVPALLRHPHR